MNWNAIVRPSQEQLAKMTPEQRDHTPIGFGKYARYSPNEIAMQEPGYVVWLYENVKGVKLCSDALYRECKREDQVGHEDD